MSTGLLEANDLVVEDGTGLPLANSYVGVTDADEYATLRQAGALANWLSANESNKVSALIFATAYLERRWRFAGVVFEDGDGDPTLAQALQFPRVFDIFDREGIEVSETVPKQVAEAAIEYAARSIDPSTFEAVPLQDDLSTQDTAGREVARERAVVGPLEEETWYSTGGTRRFADYGTADRIITTSGLLASSGETVVRA